MQLSKVWRNLHTMMCNPALTFAGEPPEPARQLFRLALPVSGMYIKYRLFLFVLLWIDLEWLLAKVTFSFREHTVDSHVFNNPLTLTRVC